MRVQFCHRAARAVASLSALVLASFVAPHTSPAQGARAVASPAASASTVIATAKDSAGRQFVDRHWVALWGVGGANDDELFAVPRELLATKEGVWVLDIGGLQLIGIDFRGKRRSTAGSKGSGPGEFTRPVDLTLAPNGDVAVLDPGNGRVSYFGANGAFRRGVASAAAAVASSFCITADNRTHFWVDRNGAEIQSIEATGKAGSSRAFPWSIDRSAPGFLRQAYFARGDASSDCRFATVFGYGVGRFAPGAPLTTSAFVESVAPPLLKLERLKSGGVRSTVTSGANAALAAFRNGDTLLVPFAGTTAIAGRQIDLYTSAGYRESWRIPICDRVAYRHPWLYCMHGMADAPTLDAYVAAADTAAVLRLFPAARNTSPKNTKAKNTTAITTPAPTTPERAAPDPNRFARTSATRSPSKPPAQSGSVPNAR